MHEVYAFRWGNCWRRAETNRTRRLRSRSRTPVSVSNCSSCLLSLIAFARQTPPPREPTAVWAWAFQLFGNLSNFTRDRFVLKAREKERAQHLLSGCLLPDQKPHHRSTAAVPRRTVRKTCRRWILPWLLKDLESSSSMMSKTREISCVLCWRNVDPR